jgi:hypothetical protein
LSPPDFRNEQEASAYEFTRQLTVAHRVDAETYARAEQTFGYKGLVDLCCSSACTWRPAR